MILPLNLNRRHKVTLFLTVVLAGIAALNGGKMMQVVGILLLGLALAWAFGSDSRVVHWLFLCLGVFLVCWTVGFARLRYHNDANLYAQKVAAFEQRIPELAKEYPLHKADAPRVREWDAAGKPVNGQIVLDKDLEPYLVKNPKAGVQIDPATGERMPPESDTSGWTPVPEPQRESRKQARRPIPPDAPVGNSGVTLDFSKAQPLAAAPATLPADFFSHLPDGGLFQLTMPDGHVRYFADKRDADHCSLMLFWDGKTQNLWSEAWIAGLDLSEVPSDELPGAPPKNPWEDAAWDAWWVCSFVGVFLFALGLGLILGISAKPLPT